MVETNKEDDIIIDEEIEKELEFLNTTDQIEEHLKPAYRKHFIEMFIRRKEKAKYKNDWSATFDKIPISDAREAAEKFWEWCESLTSLLETCILNWIITNASCAGHPDLEDKESYISFDITDERTKNLIDYVVKYRLANKIFIVKHKWVETKNGWKKDTMTTSIHVDIKRRDEVYEILEERINEHKNDDRTWDKKQKKYETEFRKLIRIAEKWDKKGLYWCSIEYDIKKKTIIDCDEEIKDELIKENFIIDDKK